MPVDDRHILDYVYRYYLAHPSVSSKELHAHLGSLRNHGAACPKVNCTCPLRYVTTQKGPYSLRAVQDLMQKVRERFAEVASVDREENRRLAIVRHDQSFAFAQRSRNTRDMIASTSRRAELDGSHVAAGEASRTTVWERVRALMVSVEDYEPSPVTEKPNYTPAVARYMLERLERLLLAADEGAARFKSLGDPPADEAQRLVWRRNVLDEAIRQTVTSPSVHPEKKRDMVIRAAGTAAMITEGADLAERLGQLEEKAK